MTPEQWANDKVEENLRYYSSGLLPLHDLTDRRNADDNIRQDYAGRFAFELLQNAADAHVKAVRMGRSGAVEGRGRVAFALTGSCLVVANTGAPFSHEPAMLPDGPEPLSSLDSITRLGESTKRGSQFMGNKGIGFRSIYQVCSRLWLLSGPYRLRYDGRETHHRLLERLREGPTEAAVREMVDYLETGRADRIPMMKVGFWFDRSELPADVRPVVERLQEEGYDTLLVLDRSDDATAERTSRFAWDRVEELSEREMLFLDSLASVSCRNEVQPHRSFELTMRSEGPDVRVVERTGRNPSATRFRVHTFPVRDLDLQRAAVAFRLDEQGRPQPAPVEERVFYTFYPASRERHGFPFYVHSYFHLSPNREYFNTEHDPLLRNRDLLDDLAEQIVAEVVPALMDEHPDGLAPELLLPRLEGSEVDRLERVLELDGHDHDDANVLAPAGSLTARFTARLLLGLAGTPLVTDLAGDRRTLGELRLPARGEDAAAADRLFADAAYGPELTPGVTPRNSRLRRCLAGLRGLQDRFFPSSPLDLSAVVGTLVAGRVSASEAADTAAFLQLVRSMGRRRDATEALEPLRSAGLRLLACSSGLQPLPTPPQQGRATRASASSPLVFYRGPAGSDGDPGGRGPNLTELPDWCHVHVLDEAVFEGVGGADLRGVLDQPLGLREFRPEDVFSRIADAVFGGDRDPGLSSEQHRDLLLTTLRLVERLRLGRAADTGRTAPPRWFAVDGTPDQWSVWYHLARSWIPVGDEWVPGDEVILGGELGGGDPLRALYPAEQVFLDEHSEAGWLKAWLDDYFDERVAGRQDAEHAVLDAGRSRFRGYVYRLLGAWDGVRLHVTHHLSAHRSKGSDPRLNPHPCVDDATWEAWSEVRREWPFKSYSFRNCRVVRSAALPHADALREAAVGPSEAAALLDGLERLGSALRRLEWADVRSRSGEPIYEPFRRVRSLLHEQLLSFPWATERRDAEPDSRLWFTQSKVQSTDPSKEAHYLRCITASKMKEPLARQLGLPVLEDAAPERLTAFIELYEMICRRAQRVDEPPGSGLVTLLKSVVGRLQQIWLGTERASAEKIAGVRQEHAESLKRLQEAGVLVHGAGGTEHRADLEGCYYDDGSDSNPVFAGHVSLVAFDANSLGIASLLGVPRLSDARVAYQDRESEFDGGPPSFEGHDDQEAEAERALSELKAPLLAFLVDSDTIPSSQRMTLDSPLFDQRWQAWDTLCVEVTPELWVQVDGGAPWRVADDRGVVLEHAPAVKGGARRLFVFESCLDERDRIPVSLMASALASFLGANSLAMQLLLERYERHGLASLDSYLRGPCGVSEDCLRDLRARAIQGRLDHQAAIDAALTELRGRLVGLDEALSERLRELLEEGHTLASRAVWQALQDGGVGLHLVADVLGGKPPQENQDRFQSLLQAHRVSCLVAAARAAGVNAAGDEFEALRVSYLRLRLSSELRWRLGALAELDAPIRDWLAGRGLPTQLPLPAGPDERVLWATLVDDGTRRQDERGARVDGLVALRPWLVAVARAASGQGIEDLAASLEELGLIAAIEQGATDEDLTDALLDWLQRQRVADDVVLVLLERWPEPPDTPAAVGLDQRSIDEVYGGLSRLDGRRDQRRIRKVRAFRKHLAALSANDRLNVAPVSIPLVAAPDVEVGSKVDGRQPSTPPRQTTAPRKKQRRGGPGQDSYDRLDFTRRVTGQCGEEFVLHVQRDRWRRLAAEDPDAARARLAEIHAEYPDIDEWPDAVAWWRWLDEQTPDRWTTDEGWERLRRALHMAGWRPQAPFDVFGLDRERIEERWSVYRIEVKATKLVGRRDFPISEGELREAKHDGERYVIWRVNGVDGRRSPTYFRLPDPQALIVARKLIAKETVSLLVPVLAAN